jgi:hypothetical protein
MTKLECQKCLKEMRFLEPHKTHNDKYLCLKCYDEESKEDPKDPVKEFFDKVGEDIEPTWFGFFNRPEYDHIVNKWDFTYVGTTSIDSFHMGATDANIKLNLPIDLIVDVFKYNKDLTTYIVCGKDYWCSYNGFTTPISGNSDYIQIS